MGEYTPEKVADLIAEARAWSALIGTKPKGARELFNRLADALEAVTAERDEALAVIADLREYIGDNGVLWDVELRIEHEGLRYILSRIPEHPKED